MVITDEGIVLSAVKYSDNRTIVKFFNAQEGLIPAIVRTSSGKNGIPKAYLSPFFLLNMVYSRSTHSDMATVKELSGGSENIGISDSIQKQALCIFAGELLKNTLEPGQSNVALFDFLKEKHTELSYEKHPGSTWPLSLILGVIHHLGFGIQPADQEGELFNTREGTFSSAHALSHPFTLSHDLSGHLNRLLTHGVQSDKSLNPRLLNALLDFLQWHVHGFKRPKSLEILREVFL
jgi:DNA repair protein RecO (recombination protein O)